MGKLYDSFTEIYIYNTHTHAYVHIYAYMRTHIYVHTYANGSREGVTTNNYRHVILTMQFYGYHSLAKLWLTSS